MTSIQFSVATQVLAAVQQTLSAHPSTSTVTVVGRSLGAVIALIDAVYLPLHLSSSITVKFIGYGLPRVGNQAFADYVDAHVTQFTRINNKEDPVPVRHFIIRSPVASSRHIASADRPRPLPRLPPPVGRGPHPGLQRVGQLPWCVSPFLSIDS